MNKILEEYLSLVDLLKSSLGNLYSVYLYEYTNEKLTLLSTDDDISENYLEIILDCINKRNNTINRVDNIINGKIYKTSVKVIYNEDGSIAGALCLTMNCSPFFKIQGIANELLNFPDSDYPLTLEGIEKFIEQYGFNENKPNINERTEIICELYDRNMFSIKGAVAKVAELLQMSPKSVYRHIATIKEARE